jgi:hypothetical protein
MTLRVLAIIDREGLCRERNGAALTEDPARDYRRTMNNERTIEPIITAHEELEGGGFEVRRPLPTAGVEHDPALLLGEAGPLERAVEPARHQLIALHKAIIDAARTSLERLEGRVTGAEMLRRLITDDRFVWLHALTELIVRFDESLDSDTGRDVADCVARALQLLRPAEQDATPFRKEYARLLQESPDVVLAHASAIGALSSVSSPSMLAICRLSVAAMRSREMFDE